MFGIKKRRNRRELLNYVFLKKMIDEQKRKGSKIENIVFCGDAKTVRNIGVTLRNDCVSFKKGLKIYFCEVRIIRGFGEGTFFMILDTKKDKDLLSYYTKKGFQ